MTSAPPPAGYPHGPIPGMPLPPGYEIRQKKKFYQKAWFWILLVIFVVIVLIFAACAAFVGGVGNELNKQSNAEHTIVYDVTATTSTVTLTYTTSSNNGVEQQNDAPVPFGKTFTAKGLFTFSSLTATLPIEADAKSSVTCKITIDGKVVSTNTSSGQFASASCSGSDTDDEVSGSPTS